MRWSETVSGRSNRLDHIRMLVAEERDTDERLLRWLKNALSDVAACVQFFVELTDADEQRVEQQRSWRSAALLREIQRVEALFTPALLTANLILEIPDGSHQFAVAFFGLVGRGRECWERSLLHAAEKYVRRTFLDGLRERTSPVEVIQRLTFGDRAVALKLMGELDFATKQFDSLDQRDKVVRHLAIFVASYREPDLLAKEVSRRYRNLMRLLHEDNLRRILTPEHAELALRSNIVRELSSLAAAARRFLTQRRALETSLEEMTAAELDFMRDIRRRRLRLIRSLLPGA